MYAQAEARKTELPEKRPMFGSVWLALFVLLRDGPSPSAGANDSDVNRGDTPSRRP